MRWAAAVVLLFALTACRSEEPPPDLDDVEATLNSIESDLNQPG